MLKLQQRKCTLKVQIEKMYSCKAATLTPLIIRSGCGHVWFSVMWLCRAQRVSRNHEKCFCVSVMRLF